MEKMKVPALNYDKQYMNNTLINRLLTTQRIEVPADDTILVFNIPIMENVVNIVELSSDPHLTVSREITPFDAAVMDASYTIMCAGYSIIPVEWIAKVMSGNNSQRLTHAKEKAIKDSVDKMRRTFITIKCEQDIRLRKSQEITTKDFIYESYMLPFDRSEIRFTSGGKPIEVYPVLKEPVFYTYAKTVNQIVSVPASYLMTQSLDSRYAFNDTDEAILIKRYVIKRIAQILADNRLQSRKISYIWYEKNGSVRGLYAELGYDADAYADWKKKRFEINKVVVGTLQNLKQNGEIRDYEPYKEHGSTRKADPVIGYEIILWESATESAGKDTGI